jgi:PQQ-like domain
LLRKTHKTFGPAFFFLLAAAGFGQTASVITNRYNNDRTGLNQSETFLNTSNVTDSAFGKLFSLPVDGPVYAQPLYLSNVNIGGVAHNVVYAVTENNSIYAFDANTPAAPLWQVNVGPPIPCSAIPYCLTYPGLQPLIGITSTPVIDAASGTIYVVAETYVSSTANFYLHALDVGTGRERMGSPVLIAGKVGGTGDPNYPADAPGGQLAFNAFMHIQRPGLLELNGNIYIGFGSHQDIRPYHGWLFGYDGFSLRRVLIKCITPNGSEGGIWQSGAGLAADALGNVYLSTGNGTFDANTGGSDYGQTVLKMNAITGMVVSTYFTPENFAALNDDDEDLSSVGPILLPGEQYAVAGSKAGVFYLLNSSQMGGYSSSGPDAVLQEWNSGTKLYGDPVFFNNILYQWGKGYTAVAWQFNGAGFNGNSNGPQPLMEGTDFIASGVANEPALAISANGTTPGSGILWATWSVSGVADGLSYQGILSAYDASTLNRLWSSEDNHSRDDLGGWGKWSTPTIANGKVYVSSFGSVNPSTPGGYAINVYGSLN